jgi:hypothetical protein
MTVTIPKQIVNEIWTRLEDQGSTQIGDEFYTLSIKILNERRGIPLELKDFERKELIHHCKQMIAIAEEDYLGEDPQFNKEARYAKQLLRKLK